jgi:hypothetical protein
MNPDQLADLKNNDILRKRMAKWMVQFCFRNTRAHISRWGSSCASARGIYPAFVGAEVSALG